MEQEDASNDHNVKPQQSDDEDYDFPEFEFPVGDCVDVDGATEESAQVENGDGIVARLPVRAHVDESPKKMPPATRSVDSEQADSRPKVSEEPAQPEVSKHVVAEESKIPTVSQASQASQRKVLQSNPSFKSLVTILGEPLKLRGSLNTEPKYGTVLSIKQEIERHSLASERERGWRSRQTPSSEARDEHFERERPRGEILEDPNQRGIPPRLAPSQPHEPASHTCRSVSIPSSSPRLARVLATRRDPEDALKPETLLLSTFFHRSITLTNAALLERLRLRST
jgi:hypothetical protein